MRIIQAKHKQPKCNICGGEEFTEGPGGRLSATGIKPQCEKCGSLERHRAIRDFFIQLKEVLALEKYSCLQIASDFSVESSWFDSYELSVYGSNNSIDIQDIERPDDSYDMVICNHVLEQVEDDIKALRELIRILKPTGLLELSVPSPYFRKTTDDWGYPKNDQHGHYRVYGKDIEDKFKQNINYPYLSCTVVDSVTKQKDILYIYSKSVLVLKEIKMMRDSNFSLTEIFIPNGYAYPEEEDCDLRYANLAE